jgi:hypothetical protein
MARYADEEPSPKEKKPSIEAISKTYLIALVSGILAVISTALPWGTNPEGGIIDLPQGVFYNLYSLAVKGSPGATLVIVLCVLSLVFAIASLVFSKLGETITQVNLPMGTISKYLVLFSFFCIVISIFQPATSKFNMDHIANIGFWILFVTLIISALSVFLVFKKPRYYY